MKEEKLVEINPLKDFVIHQNKYHKELKKGVKDKVPERYIQNLKTEKVIPGGKKHVV